MKRDDARASARQAEATVEAFIGIGSNIGDREGWLRRAVEELDRSEGVTVSRCSPMYETEPVGYTDQASFLNMVAVVRTALEAEALHDRMKRVEAKLGRTRDIRWGPRTIDLDLLLMDGVERSGDSLTVPHPRLHERAFVLVPLLDVVSGTMSLYESLKRSLDTLEGKGGVKRWSNFNWPSESGRSGS